MNKFILIIASLLFFSLSYAQEDEEFEDLEIAEEEVEETEEDDKKTPSKPGSTFLAIQLDLVSAMKVLGGTNFNNQTISLRYHLNEKMAVRASLSLGASSDIEKGYVRDDFDFYNNPLSTAKVEDKEVTNMLFIETSFAFLMYKNYNKLSMYYGMQAGISYETTKKTYTYGNSITSLNNKPSTHNFGNNIIGKVRDLTTNSGSIMTIPGGFIIGGEYAINKNLAIGAEFMLGYAHKFKGQKNKTTEEWDGTKIFERDVPQTPKSISGEIYSQNAMNYGNFYITYYFRQ